MKWVSKLERKLYKYSISDLMKYIVMITSVVFAFTYFTRSYMLINLFSLNSKLVMQGQIWRLITFIFVPPTLSMLSFILMMFFYYMIGNALESELGSFKFNLYYLTGVIASIVAAFLTGYGSITYVNLSLFLAFARIYPEHEVLLFFILPIKMKYLGWLNWIFIIYSIIMEPMPLKIAAIASIANYFIFFGKESYTNIKGAGATYKRRREYESKTVKMEYYHKCTICGITEKDDPSMDFRYCSKCDGNYEYCMNHLHTHEHIK